MRAVGPLFERQFHRLDRHIWDGRFERREVQLAHIREFRRRFRQSHETFRHIRNNSLQLYNEQARQEQHLRRADDPAELYIRAAHQTSALELIAAVLQLH